MATKSKPPETAKVTAPKSDSAGDVAVLDDEDIDPAGQDEPIAQERRPWPVRLYLGEIGFDFIGKRKLWYTISAALILICIGSMIFRQFNLGVEFAGGERFRVAGTEQQLPEVSRAVEGLGAQVTSAQAVGANQLVIITADLTEEEGARVSAAIADTLGVDVTEVANSTTSASWGRDVTSKALQGLLVFIVLVLVFLAVRFQWKMAAGAMVALVHDLLITAGVYSIVGFEVTPASVIGLLTILGFSLYDTVVVFDKVDENAKGLLASQRRTYSESANLAINQVLMRSINTSIFALLPVLGLLYAGVFLIGEGTLQDLALVLFVGMLAGVYSSIFLAAPVLCDLKEREPEYQKLAKRVNARRASGKPALGDVDSSPAGANSRARGSGKADTRATATPSKAVVDRADEPDKSDELDREDDAGRPDEPVSGSSVVASARRSRPRSTRSPAAKASSAAKAISATATLHKGVAVKTRTVRADPTEPGTPESEASKPSKTSGKSESAGSRLAPRPGAKPTRRPRTRGGAAKQN
ncbi:MAG: protein translocase subunit SecF [Geodermatophilaceae bacterium]|nr:protein translocase subunit SecF [Geodermatophilaceae bacterium]